MLCNFDEHGGPGSGLPGSSAAPSGCRSGSSDFVSGGVLSPSSFITEEESKSSVDKERSRRYVRSHYNEDDSWSYLIVPVRHAEINQLASFTRCCSKKVYTPPLF